MAFDDSTQILEDPISFVSEKLLDPIGGTKTDIKFSWIMSKFLMDREQAGLFWVNFPELCRPGKAHIGVSA
jgi:hypothetical protein